KRPEVDEIPVRVTGTVSNGTVVPHYPVIQYGHVPGGGDAIGSGFLYRGKALPALQGKYVFSDISTGRIWYADYKEMLAADAAHWQVAAQEVKLRWDKSTFDTMFPIVGIAYHSRGGKIEKLPGRALVSGEGRADAQLTVDAAGELYILTKTDGTIRAVVGATVKQSESYSSRRAATGTTVDARSAGSIDAASTVTRNIAAAISIVPGSSGAMP